MSEAADALSQAHSTIAALRAEMDRWKSEAADHFIALQYSPDHSEIAALEAEVKRLTEEKEALRAAASDALHFITDIDNAHPVVRKIRRALSGGKE